MNSDDSSVYTRVKSQLKQLIFTTYASLLQTESHFPMTFRVSFFIIELFQLLHFFFKSQLLIMWSNAAWSNPIQNFLKYFILTSYFSLTTYNTYVIFLYVLSVLFFGIFLASVYIGTTNSQKNRKNRSMGFVFTVVRAFNEILPQVLFTPVLDFFFSFFRCVQNDNNQLVNSLFPEVICYQSDYIMHSFIAGLAFGIFLFYSVLNVLYFYEIRNKAFTAKLRCDMDFYLLLFKVVLEIAFSFLGDNQNIILMGILSFGYMVFFLVNNNAFNYYNDFLQRISISEIAILTWSGIMIVFCKITFDLPFDAYLFVWIVGVGVVILIKFTQIKINYDLLIVNTEALSNDFEAIEILDNLCFLLEEYKKNRNAGIALDGFVEYHKTFCNALSCPSRKEYDITSIKNSTITDNDNKYMLQLSHLISVIFFKALQRFPNCIPLRIRYCIFLLDRMGQKQGALQELLITSGYKLKSGEEFLVFRLKQHIERDIYEENTNSQRLEFNELFLRDILQSLQANIEKSSNLNMEFWNLLSEDCPNLSKLKEIGVKISALNKSIVRNQKVLQNMNVTIPKIQILYSKYLMTIMRDRESSEKVFEKLQETNLHQQNKLLTVYFSEYFHDSSPMVIISADDKTLGYINYVSLSLSSALGYSRSELMNRKVNILMTSLYSSHHDRFIEDYLATLESRILNKETELPVKTKTNYIKKATLCIKVYNTVLQGAQFLGMFKFEKMVKQYCYVICDVIGNILEFSSSCMPALGLDRKKVLKRKIQIQDLIPDFFGNIAAMKNKNGVDLIVHILDREDLKQEEEKSINRLNSNIIMNVYINSEIKFKNTDLLGYFIRLEPKPIYLSAVPRLQIPQTKQEVFRMQFDVRNKMFIGSVNEQNIDSDVRENVNMDDEHLFTTGLPVFNSGLESEIPPKIEVNQQNDDFVDLEINAQKKEYSHGIRTLRLVNNRLMDMEEIKKAENEDEENEEEENLEESPLKLEKGESSAEDRKEIEGEDDRDVDGNYKSLENFKLFLNNKKSRKFNHLTNLKYVGLTLIITLLMLSMIGFFQTKNEMDLRLADNNLIVLSNKRSAETMTILNTINQLFLLNKNWTPKNTLYQEFQLRSILNASIFELSALQKDIQGSQSTCTSLVSTDIKVKFSKANGTFDIDQTTSQLIAKAFNLLTNTSLSDFNENNLDILFIRENSLKYYFDALMDLSDSCFNFVNSKLDHINSLSLIFLIIPTLVILISWTFSFFIVFFGILKFEQEILRMFLCLPIEKVKDLVKESENFHSQFKIGEMEQNDEEGSEKRLFTLEEEIEEEFKVKTSNKKRKKFKIETGKYKMVFIYTFLFFFSFEVYYAGAYVLLNNALNKFSDTMNEFNVTSVTLPMYGYYNNIIREVIIEPAFTTISEGNVTNDLLMMKISDFYDDFYQIQAQHKKNSNYFSTYNSFFSDLFSDSGCNDITDNPFNINCSQFSSSILMQGLMVALPNFFENERYISSLWTYILTNPNVVISDIFNISNSVSPTGNNQLQANLINLLKMDIIEETNILCETFLKGAFKVLIDEFQKDINNSFDSSDLQLLTLLICFLAFLVTTYLFFWIPFMNSLKKDNMETINLLLMIPLRLVKSSNLLLKEIEEKFQQQK